MKWYGLALGDRVEIATRLEVRETCERLAAVTRLPVRVRVGWLFGVTDPNVVFGGGVRGRRVWIGCDSRSWLNPVLYGRVMPSSQGAVIRGRVRVRPHLQLLAIGMPILAAVLFGGPVGLCILGGSYLVGAIQLAVSYGDRRAELVDRISETLRQVAPQEE